MTLDFSRLRRRALLVSLLALAACATFETTYDAPVPAGSAAGWRLADVTVQVPQSLTVAEAKGLVPRGDILWREDPPGDRHAQVAAIVATAVRQGASGLTGSRPVVIDVYVSRFHAVSFEAEARLTRSGVHNVDFTATVRDARTGEILAGPTSVEAAEPAFVGAEAVARRAAGETQKSVIIAHLAAVIAGWLGTGPDPRREFRRLGM